MQRLVWSINVITVAITALFCGRLGAIQLTDPSQSPEIDFVVPSIEDMGGLLFASSPTTNASDLRQVEEGPFILRKGEWLFFRFTETKVSYSASIQALSKVAGRLWSAEFAHLDNESLSALAALTELRVLQFGISRGASAERLSSLSKLCYLTRLNVTIYNSSELVALRHITAVKSLKELRLSLNKSSSENLLDALIGHAALEVLVVTDWPSLTDNGMSKIAKIPKLQLLGVSGCTKITATGIAALKGLSLSSLDIGGCDRVGNEGAQAIAAMSGLQMLYAKASGITDDGIKHLGKLTKLDTLDLSDNFGITDACLADLKKLSALKNLNLSGTELTDKAVDVLKEMQTLQSLNVESTGITAKAIADLKKALPKAKINETR